MILLQDETDSIAETDSDRDRGTRGVEMETGSGDIRDTGAMNLTSGGSRPNSRPTSGHTDPADHDVSITYNIAFELSERPRMYRLALLVNLIILYRDLLERNLSYKILICSLL